MIVQLACLQPLMLLRKPDLTRCVLKVLLNMDGAYLLRCLLPRSFTAYNLCRIFQPHEQDAAIA